MACYERAQRVKWRRRESNPDADFPKPFSGQPLQSGCEQDAAPEQHTAVPERRFLATNGTQLSSLPAAVTLIAEAWQKLPPHIREAILTLVDTGAHAVGSADSARPANGVMPDELAWQMARRCRSVVQSCLPEEEWTDADQEFFEVITKELARLKCVKP